MNSFRHWRSAGLCVLLFCGCSTMTTTPPAQQNSAAMKLPDFAQLPTQSALPEPLVMLNGDKVTSEKQWTEKRRPELKALFEHYMYGAIPPKPAKLDFK